MQRAAILVVGAALLTNTPMVGAPSAAAETHRVV